MAEARRIYQILGCEDYARIDFRLRGQVPYVLEVNPNPCINPGDSGFIRSSQAAGYTYTEVINRILIESVCRHGLPLLSVREKEVVRLER
jgi:D-alanine-D-alanine ligase